MATTYPAPSRPCSGTVHGPTAADVMVSRPKVLPADASVGDVRAQFEDDHVVMVLLGGHGVLLGTLLREDLPHGADQAGPARPFSTTTGRTVPATEPVAAVHRRLREAGARRLAVVDGAGRLLGLVCLKRSRTGFCDDAGVAARRAAPALGADRELA